MDCMRRDSMSLLPLSKSLLVLPRSKTLLGVGRERLVLSTVGHGAFHRDAQEEKQRPDKETQRSM